MMNTVSRGKKVVKIEGYWDDSSKVDINKIPYKMPKEFKDNWPSRELFVAKLKKIEQLLTIKKQFIIDDTYDKCLIDSSHELKHGFYQLDKIRWAGSLMHYIEVHKVKPSDEFINFISGFQPRMTGEMSIKRIVCDDKIISGDIQYLKIERNQMEVMDALMIHGGYDKKYVDKLNRNKFRFSEHAGLLDFDFKGLDRLLVSMKVNRVDKTDDEIFQPNSMKESTDYEYIFHTHPPTPTPGARVKYGIIYEFPSIPDIFFFVSHFNSGVTQGSIVITPEGVYNIRALNMREKKLNINDNSLYRSLQKIFNRVQDDAIKKYGTKITKDIFYKEVAQDITHIDAVNKVLKKYFITIDYFPRIKTKNNRWVLDSMLLPVTVIEPRNNYKK